jgi:hypothetical protein
MNIVYNNCRVVGKIDKTILIIDIPATSEKRLIDIEDVIDIIPCNL